MKWVRTQGRAGQLVPSFLLGARVADSNPGGARGLTLGWSPRGVQEDQSLNHTQPLGQTRRACPRHGTLVLFVDKQCRGFLRGTQVHSLRSPEPAGAQLW